MCLVAGKDPEQGHAHGQSPEEIEHAALLVAALERLVEQYVRRLGHGVERARLLRGDVDLELDVTYLRRQVLADLLRKLLPRHAQGLGRDVSSVGVPLVDQPPLELARYHRRPRLSELATGRVAVAVRPPVDVRQQRPFGQRLEAVDSLERVAAEQQLERRPEDLAQLQV